VGEAKLGLRECWIFPCTMDAWRWCPYEPDGRRSRAGESCPLDSFVALAGVADVGVLARGTDWFAVMVSALPRIADVSRDGGSD
jgi:hypothetical protein